MFNISIFHLFKKGDKSYKGITQRLKISALKGLSSSSEAKIFLTSNVKKIGCCIQISYFSFPCITIEVGDDSEVSSKKRELIKDHFVQEDITPDCRRVCMGFKPRLHLVKIKFRVF